MADNIQVALGYAIQGLKDSMRGIPTLYNMDKGIAEDEIVSILSSQSYKEKD